MKLNKNFGFTLIELLVVIAIIGFISVLAVAAMSTVRAKSRDAKRLADIKQIQAALNLYYNDRRMYPTLTAYLGRDTTRKCLTTSSAGFTTLGCPNAFMAVIPKDPGVSTANANQYYFRPATAQVTGQGPQNYYLRFNLERGYESYRRGYNYITPNGSITTVAPF